MNYDFLFQHFFVFLLIEIVKCIRLLYIVEFEVLVNNYCATNLK